LQLFLGASFWLHNAARFGTEDEAASSLFGVARSVFTGVEERVGLIARADRKVLFVDEAHNLPYRVQKSLLRVMEDSIVSRIGETRESRPDVRFILASNESPPLFGLAHDLVARLRVIEISALKQRAADIPSIFRHVVRDAFRRIGREDISVDSIFSIDHYELLSLDGFCSDNTRGLMRIANCIAEEITAGAAPREAVRLVFEKRFSKNPVLCREYQPARSAVPVNPAPLACSTIATTDPQSLLDELNLNQETVHLIRLAYAICNGQVVIMAQYLKDHDHVHISRNRLAEILDIMKLPRIKRTR
jgi:transcriptional regulator with AAA-type ATPase domain